MASKWIFSCFLALGQILIASSAVITPSGLTSEMETKTTTTNLTTVGWAHAVNSQKELTEALNSNNVDMIEADIVLGTLINSTSSEQLPVMAHPPNKTSDISLASFLKQILKYNEENKEKSKGVKLDFKSTNVFQGSLKILNDLWVQMKYPVWLNADIIEGPVNANTTKPVDPVSFFNGCKIFDSAILSIGWTTKWGDNYTVGSYSNNHIENMLEAIKENNITNTKHELTFPVRAGIAAQSLSQLRSLFTTLNDTNKVTLTIWSSKNDNVDIKKLRDLILTFGVDKVYLDVPEEVSSKLNLGEIITTTTEKTTETTTGRTNAAPALRVSISTWVQISILVLSVLFTSFIFKKHSIVE